jgi:hypothetical protein
LGFLPVLHLPLTSYRRVQTSIQSPSVGDADGVGAVNVAFTLVCLFLLALGAVGAWYSFPRRADVESAQHDRLAVSPARRREIGLSNEMLD